MLMLVWISRPPKGMIDDIEVDRLPVSTVQDLPASVANVLVAEGWAKPEMRVRPRKEGDPRRRADTDFEDSAEQAARHTAGEPLFHGEQYSSLSSVPSAKGRAVRRRPRKRRNEENH